MNQISKMSNYFFVITLANRAFFEITYNEEIVADVLFIDREIVSERYNQEVYHIKDHNVMAT